MTTAAYVRHARPGFARRATSHLNREHRAAQAELLRRCRATLALWYRLHAVSVRIGEGQQAGLTDGDLFGLETREAARIVEQADILCAEIAKLEGT